MPDGNGCPNGGRHCEALGPMFNILWWLCQDIVNKLDHLPPRVRAAQLQDYSQGFAGVAYVAEHGKRLLRAMGRDPVRRVLTTKEEWVELLVEVETYLDEIDAGRG